MKLLLVTIDILRFCFSKFNNNECNIEGFIGALGNQSFINQHEDTLDNRGMIKLNAHSRAVEHVEKKLQL